MGGMVYTYVRDNGLSYGEGVITMTIFLMGLLIGTIIGFGLAHLIILIEVLYAR